MLWSLLYGTLTRILLAVAIGALPIIRRFRPKLAKWIAMRYFPRPLRFQPKLWIHAVSVGEIQVARSLLDRIGNDHVLLTTTTQAAYKILRQNYGSEAVRYLPWDLPGCYRRLMGSYKVPHLLVVETEIWPALFRLVTNAGSKLVVVNGRISVKTMRLRNNSLFRSTLARVTRVLARGEDDASRFLAFGVPPSRVSTLGNIKFDAKPRPIKPGLLKQWLEASQPLVLFASISSDEAPLLAPQLIQLLAEKPDLRALWAPRHLEHLDQHLAALAPLSPQLRSLLEPGQLPRLLVLDSFGELSGTYAAARLALVGGSFNQRGGQNFLESLQSGTPVLVGPSTDNFFEETAEALQLGAMLRLLEPAQVATTFAELLDDKVRLAQMAENADTFLSRHGGAIERTRQELLNLEIISDH